MTRVAVVKKIELPATSIKLPAARFDGSISMVTLSREKLRESGARGLKLLSGVVMLALGFILLLTPEWLAQ